MTLSPTQPNVEEQAQRTDGRASILLVDDRPENLVALAAILESLGQPLVRATSADEALGCLLRHDFAVILLDVQMPGTDGFELARLIKQRERTRHVPIIFLTAVGTSTQQMFAGYRAGAVDYVTKPFDPDVLRTKVAVFIELWEKNRELRHQAELLRRRELEDLRRESEERYRQLADAMPQIVWTSAPDGRATYYNSRWFEYTGLSAESWGPADWRDVVHPDDLPATIDRQREAFATGAVFEMEYRFRAADGSYRWHLGRAVPIRGDDGDIQFWIGTATDIDARRRAEDAQRFLLEAGAELASSLDYRRTLSSVARLAVAQIADWCVVDVAEDGAIRALEIAHVDPAKELFARELRERYPPDPEAPRGTPAVIRTGRSELVPEIPDEMLVEAARDELHLSLLRELGLRSYMCVPLAARGRTLGAIAFVAAESGRRFGPEDLELAEELARRAAVAIDNAQLYDELERRAEAARALATIADGVFLLDRDGRIRLWNAAAEAITGLPADAVLGRPAEEAISGWREIAPLVPLADAPGPTGAETVPLEIDGRELWLSISAVGSAEGVVYAFRDLTEQRGVEHMKSEFVATISHELRTPLAAIYGAAMTLRRRDLELSDELRERLLAVVADESDRLAGIVNDVLLASHLESGKLQLSIVACDGAELARSVVEAARVHAPENVTFEVEAPPGLPPVAADGAQLRQVLANLVDNAVKYSPQGGLVRLELRAGERFLCFSVRDRGIGIPPAERRRIFEKFYRLDPNMTHGVGGTGLGLYICRELVRRLDGRVWVEPNENGGSVFHVELPLAKSPRRRGAKAKAGGRRTATPG